MSTPTTSWDETLPAGSDPLNQGDNRIRELKTQIREVINVDHKFNDTGSDDDNGKHNQVHLLEQADIGSGASGKPIIGAQTIDSKPELVFTDEDDNDIQMTIKGTPVAINGCTAKTVPVAADLLLISDSADSFKSKKMTVANILNFMYPVGMVVTLGVATNPGTLFGVGTWTAITGKVIVGIDGTTEFLTLNQTGGEKTHVLITAEIPSHNHAIAVSEDGGGYDNSTARAGNGNGHGVHPALNYPAGGDGAHNNLQPYIVKYVWERTS